MCAAKFVDVYKQQCKRIQMQEETDLKLNIDKRHGIEAVELI